MGFNGLKVENDVLFNMEKDKVTALTLRDISSAFDTIDHFTLINRLKSWYGIYGTALYIVLGRPMSTGKNAGLYF